MRMKKLVFIIKTLFLGTFLSSCSTYGPKDDFTIAGNCTPRAQAQLEKYQTPDLKNKEEQEKRTAEMKAITAPIANKAADVCFYKSKESYTSTYNVCPLISTNEKGTVVFIDVEDNLNKLPTKLHKCLTEAFAKGDYSKLPSTTFGQPLTLTPKSK